MLYIRLATRIVAAWLNTGSLSETYIQTDIVYLIHSNDVIKLATIRVGWTLYKKTETYIQTDILRISYTQQLCYI